MSLVQVILGATLVVAAIIMLIVAIVRTPINLRGFYGAMYAALAVAAFLGGGALATFGILALL